MFFIMISPAFSCHPNPTWSIEQIKMTNRKTEINCYYYNNLQYKQEMTQIRPQTIDSQESFSHAPERRVMWVHPHTSVPTYWSFSKSDKTVLYTDKYLRMNSSDKTCTEKLHTIKPEMWINRVNITLHKIKCILCSLTGPMLIHLVNRSSALIWS